MVSAGSRLDSVPSRQVSFHTTTSPTRSSRYWRSGGHFYVCGSGRQALKYDKTADSDYAMLTLAAIAEELRARGQPATADVILAIGLPLTRYGREKQAFSEYLLSSFPRPVSFKYEGEAFKISIKSALVYPQGYAAIMSQIPQLMQEPSVIVADVGSWTVDVMRLDYGRANAETCKSLEMGMIRCVSDTLEQVRRTTGFSLTEPQIEQIIRGEKSGLDDEILRLVSREVYRYTANLTGTLMESGFDIRAVPTIFLGGGAALVEHNAASELLKQCSFIKDIHANAKGYEQIARQVLRNG